MRPQHTAFWTAFFLSGCLFALIAGWSIVWYRCRMTADPPALLEASPVILDMHTSGNDRFFFRIRIFEWEEFFSILFIPLR